GARGGGGGGGGPRRGGARRAARRGVGGAPGAPAPAVPVKPTPTPAAPPSRPRVTMTASPGDSPLLLIGRAMGGSGRDSTNEAIAPIPPVAVSGTSGEAR